MAALLLFAGHPPLDVVPAGWFALVALLALAFDCSKAPRPWRAGFGWGLLAGALSFAALLEWIARFGVIPWILLALFLGAFVGAWTAVMARWGRTRGWALAGVALWVGLEAVRANVPFGGFPWGLLGYTQHGGGPLLPAARTLGVLGVGALCAGLGVALYAAAGALWRAWGAWRTGDATQRPAALDAARVPLAAVPAVLALAVLFGAATPTATGATLDVAAVQGNDLPETSLVGNARKVDVAQRMAALTARVSEDPAGPPDLVVWPENALDGDVRGLRNPALSAQLDRALGHLDGVPLLAGVILEEPRARQFRNTMAMIDASGSIGDVYVKRRYVPFGEYIPGRRLLQWIPPLAQVPRDGVPGEGPSVFDVAGARVGAVICFENIFPGLVADQVRAGTDVLLVSTNNASFGFSAASRQHLAMTRLRAVESGRWVLHAGLSGISAVVDPQGRSSQETELFEQAIVRAQLPLLEGLTPAVRLGRWIDVVALLAGLAALGALGLRLRRRRP